MTDIALQVDNISKHFNVARARGTGNGKSHDPRRERISWHADRFWALREVSFAIGRGQTLGIVGPNGSGKSTLLKMLSGVMTPDSGVIKAQGRIGALLELGAGFHPELSGLENVYLNGALLGLTTRDVDRLLPEIIAFAELERFMDLPVKHFSSGMAARLGFAVATCLAPEILMMDETFATGDAMFQIKALEHIADMRRRGHTMIIVSHNLEIMMHLTDRVLWLDHGTVRRDGPTRDVLADYRRSRVDMGSIERVRHTLGLESLFDDADPDRGTVKIADCGLRIEENAEGGLRNPDLNSNPIEIQTGQTLVLELTLAHPEKHPRRVAVETAWSRGDSTVMVQSRALVELAPGAETRCGVRLGPWQLTEGTWRGLAALSAAGSSAEAPARFRYYDRTTQPFTVRTLTPNIHGIQVLTTLSNEWTV